MLVFDGKLHLPIGNFAALPVESQVEARVKSRLDLSSDTEWKFGFL